MTGLAFVLKAWLVQHPARPQIFVEERCLAAPLVRGCGYPVSDTEPEIRHISHYPVRNPRYWKRPVKAVYEGRK